MLRFRVSNSDSDPGVFITAAYILESLNRNFYFLQYISIECFEEIEDNRRMNQKEKKEDEARRSGA